jgi:hypothetical protein
MWATVGIVGFGIGLCLAYKSDHERPWLLTLLPVTVGAVLLTLPELDRIAFVIAGYLVEWARTAAEWSAPYLLLLALYALLWRLARRWWRMYRAFGPLERGRVLLLSLFLGIAIASLLHVAPFLPDAARVAGEGARAGLEAGVQKSLDEAGERLNGGEAP